MAVDTSWYNWNVKTFGGALGDGSTNDTTAIQNTINAADASGDTTPIVYFPEGQYRISQITLPAGIVLQGVHSSAYGVPGGNMDKPGWPVSVLESIASSNEDMVVMADTKNYQRIYDLGIDGNKNNNTSGGGIHISDGASGQECQVILERVFVFNTADSGIYLGKNRRAVKVINCVSNYSANGDGITVTNSASTIQGCIFGSNARAGICLGSTTGLRWASFGNNNASAVTHVFNNDIYSNLVGISVGKSSWGSLILGNGLDRNSNEGVAVYDGYNTVIHCNCFHSNGTATDNTYGHVGVGSSVSQVAIGGNDFGPLDGGITKLASYGVDMYSGFSGTVVGDYGVIDPTSVKNSPPLNGGLHN